MNSVPRKLTLGLSLALVAVACGDDVTVTEQPQPTPVVRSVLVSPSAATVAPGGSFTFGAAVEADAGLARTVTWSSSNTSVATVDNGVAAASSSLTTGGVTSICAASTVDANIKGCAQLTVAPAAAPATVQIDAITVACHNINIENPAFVACDLDTPVQVNNVFGQIDVAVAVNRPAGSGLTGVEVTVLGGANFATVEATLTESFSTDFIAASDAGTVAAQTSQVQNRIVFQIQTAAYTFNPTTNVVTVRHPNGPKKIRTRLLGGASSAQAETQLTFRNANGWHVQVATNINTGNNSNSTCTASGAAACPVRVNSSTTGLAWNGGTPLAITASAVNFTNFPAFAQAGTGTGVAFGSFACDQSGLGPRASGIASTTIASNTPANGTGPVVSGTLSYTNGAVATPGTLNAYSIAPGGPCGAGGETPGAIAVDATGNSYVNIPLTGPFFAGNIYNNVLAPMEPTLGTAPAIRLDNGGPAPIAGYATGRNTAGAFAAAGPDECFGLWLNGVQTDAVGNGCAAVPATAIPTLLTAPDLIPINATPQAAFVGGRTARMNGWVNDAVNFGALHANMVVAAGLTGGDANGAIAPSGNATGLPLDITGIGNTITFTARIGACTTIATCAALAPRTSTTGLTETGTGFTYGTIIQTVDAFGNVTNPPAVGGNFALVPNPVDPLNPYVVGGVLFIGVDRTIPTVISQGGGVTPGASVVGTTFTNNTIQGNPGTVAGAAPPLAGSSNYFYSAQDAIPTGLTGTSGILTVAPGSDLYVSQSRRDGLLLQHFCPTSGNYQLLSSACGAQTGWAGATQTFNMGAGFIGSDPAAAGVRAYYAISVFTRDQAGNQSSAANQTAQARDFIWDNTPPASFGATFSPGVLPANGTVTFSGAATEDLDVGRATWTIRFPSLTDNGIGADFIRLPWANKAAAGQLANPIGYLAAGPVATQLSLTSAPWQAIRSIEVVTPGDNTAGPTIGGVPGAPTAGGGFTIGAGVGAIQFPGGLNGGGAAIAFTQDRNAIATGSGPTQFNFFAQSVSRVGLQGSAGPQGTVPLNQATAINYGQTGMGTGVVPCTGVPGTTNTPAGPGFWSAVQAAGLVCNGVANQFFNMQWALVNPSVTPATLDLNSGAARALTAVAFGANGPMQSPFLGGVRFFAVDLRQPLNVDDPGGLVAPPGPNAAAAIGAGLVEISCVGGVTAFNDQATNTWRYNCSYSPGTGGASSMIQAHDFAGFNFANSVSLAVNWVGGVATPNGAAVPNQGFWGLAQLGQGPAPAGFNQGWQGNAAVAAIAGGNNIPVIAIGCNTTGNCLSTRVSTNAGFNVTP